MFLKFYWYMTRSFFFLQKPLGLLSLLDEESTFPNGTDLTFANKLKQHLKSNPCFKGEREKAFAVSHYAGEVMNNIILLVSCTFFYKLASMLERLNVEKWCFYHSYTFVIHVLDKLICDKIISFLSLFCGGQNL